MFWRKHSEGNLFTPQFWRNMFMYLSVLEEDFYWPHSFRGRILLTPQFWRKGPKWPHLLNVDPFLCWSPLGHCQRYRFSHRACSATSFWSGPYVLRSGVFSQCENPLQPREALRTKEALLYSRKHALRVSQTRITLISLSKLLEQKSRVNWNSFLFYVEVTVLFLW